MMVDIRVHNIKLTRFEGEHDLYKLERMSGDFSLGEPIILDREELEALQHCIGEMLQEK